MSCACRSCANKRQYYLWLLSTLEDCGMQIPKVLEFNPEVVSNTRLDSAINRLLKIYRVRSTGLTLAKKAPRQYSKRMSSAMFVDLCARSWLDHPYEVE